MSWRYVSSSFSLPVSSLNPSNVRCPQKSTTSEEAARGTGDLNHLASPVMGGGFALGRLPQLFLLASTQGRKTPDDWARFAWDILASQNQRLIKDGKTLETAEDNLAELRGQAEQFSLKGLPVLRALQIA